MRGIGCLRLRSRDVVLLALLWWPGLAAATITVNLDFDLLPDGSTPPYLQPVGAVYGGSGVTFGSLDAGPSSILPKFYPDNAPRTEWSVAGTNHAGAGSHGFHVVASFAVPVSSVSAYLCTGSNYAAVMNAFDAGGAQIGTTSSPASLGQCKGTFALEGIGEIASVVWTSSDPFVAGIFVDDLSFAIVPEPASGSLLALGLLGVALARRRAGALR